MPLPPFTTDPQAFTTPVAPSRPRGHGRPDERTHPLERAFWWVVAPVDSRKHGLSLTRLLAIGFFWGTVHLAHDWIALSTTRELGWSFASFVIGGFTLSVATALGGKYVLGFMTSKFGAASAK